MISLCVQPISRQVSGRRLSSLMIIFGICGAEKTLLYSTRVRWRHLSVPL
ncbi:hypothetical protein EVA_17234 [gut metagenome]|uniref:Uncharacterized protein n=1 Tax=gut metagenome TaxID=749906 RepID=J9FJR8_9ZZZZ